MKLQSLPELSVTAARPVGTCRLCGAGLHHSFIDLGMSPLCESFLRAEQLDAMEPYLPLHALICDTCFLVQLKEYVSPEHIFREYAYFSSYSTSWVAHAKAYCEKVTSRFGLGPESLVVELASNDGYLLQHFPPLGVPVLGIEPAANVAKVAIGKGIPTRVEFFGVALAQQLVAEGRQADLIAGNNVLAQVPDLNDFVAGMSVLLKPEGIITLEFPHLARLMAENQFDTIYHEHFSYFSLLTIAHMAERHRLRIVDVEELPTHGGSLRVYLARAESRHEASGAVAALLAREKQLGFDDVAAYAPFAEQVKRTKRRLLSLLIDLRDAGHRICGYGAPGKGNTLLNYCGIGPDFLDFTVDRNPYKHGLFTPGMHVPIRPVEAIDAARPDYLLILPWNLKTEITRQMRHVAEWGGKFIVPIPEPTIIDPKDVCP
ncbi:Class I SAM-dependent methyltransferase [Rhodovastum atsumiense]|uniref:Class I SAM-dependent methyltransferase n=1 Tax=Rhodovastum atsumiense TaxID=504468 RepID=A0A5M6IUQ6_9PROT|nr:class I SAM-dependent methyltransferase [Rhodovastum atsumiense]KAA5611961.1 class I SAM-dependent methyltransferase [Rhodovastum atsumiense]CAH2598737.1 Class I SAM-dependent methyltransferase [Rhodovastum atsumiense]